MLLARPPGNPKRLFADLGNDYDKHRRLLWKRGIQPLIARRGVAHGTGLGLACSIVRLRRIPASG